MDRTGSSLGDGAIIGMRSVVGSDVPPYTVVAGNPARSIRKRFDDELIGMMLELRWWDMAIEEIDRLIPILSCSDLDKVRKAVAALLKERNGSGPCGDQHP